MVVDDKLELLCRDGAYWLQGRKEGLRVSRELGHQIYIFICRGVVLQKGKKPP